MNEQRSETPVVEGDVLHPGENEPRQRAIDPPMVPFAIAGMIGFAIAALVLLPFRDWLSEHGHTDWLWTCVAGFFLGFPGLATMIVHDRNRRRRMAAEAGGDPAVVPETPGHPPA